MAKKGRSARAAKEAAGARTATSRAERGADREPTIGAGLAAAIYFGVALLYMLPAFLPGRHLFGTDYLAGGYFFNEFVSQRLAAGELPKWVPYIYGGLPFYANPGSSFLPLRLVTDLLFPTTWILPTIFWVQFGLGGLGMFLLARELGARPWIAFVCGVAFELTGITLSMTFAGHDGRAIVATLAPMFFFFLHRGIRTGSVHPFVGAAATLGWGLLSFQIQSNYYLLIGGALWAAYLLVQRGFVKEPRALGARIALGLGAVALAFTLAAVYFLPFQGYVADSPRGEARGYEYSTSWAMAPGELVGLAVPEQYGMIENYQGENPIKFHTEYVGALVVVLLILGVRFSHREPDWWFFVALSAFALSLSFGGHTPLYRLYYAVLPMTKQFRAPSISFFLVALSLIAMAAITFERIARARAGDERDGADEGGGAPRLLLWLGVIAGVALLAAGIVSAGGAVAPREVARVAGYGRFAAFAVLTCGALGLWWARWLNGAATMALLAVVTAADLVAVDRKFFRTVEAPEVMFAPDDVVQFLESQPGDDRVWAMPLGVPYSAPADYLMLFGIEQAGGEHGNQLQRFNEFAGEDGNSYVNWSNLVSSTFLRAANVRWVITGEDLAAAGADTTFFRLAHRGSANVYEVPALPRAYLVQDVITTTDSTAALARMKEPGFDVARTAVVYTGDDLGLPQGAPLTGNVTMESHEPDRVVVRAEADRPALLVLADNFHRDWVATVNGQEVPIRRANHTFRGVVVPAGTSEVVFEFRPGKLYVGLAIYGVVLALFIVYGIGMAVVALRRRGEPAAATS